MPIQSGTRLGPYEIVAPLGAGGMGEVYRARDTRLGREVAIKVLSEGLSSHPDRLARLEREAKTVAALNHPNIVTLHSIEEVEGVRFLTMELVEGQNLERLLTPGGLPLSRVLELTIPLADALSAAHERGVVHRDLKPANVMVTREGRVKVLDFGLAKLTSAGLAASESNAIDVTQAVPQDSPISSAGQVVGTVPYMAPEQLRGEVVDARSDLFAFGIMLYELVTGKRPFKGATSADVSSSILRDVPAPLQNLRADLPSDLHRIIGRCLEKDPERRFQTAKDVRNELELVRGATDSPSSSPSKLSHAAAAPALRDDLSIAVLPFVNRSRDEEDEYFSDGLADELMNVLAKIRGLRVAARTSCYHFKGKNEELAAIGQKLNVATLLEGSVRKAGNRVRIAVQLVKVADGFQLWSETYDRTLDDIFAVQDDIAQSVVKELRTTLLGEEPDSKASGEVKAAIQEAAKGRAENPEAHRLLLQGRYLIERFSQAEVAKGVAYLEQALALDPDYALAWVELSRAYAQQAGYGWRPLKEGVALARAAVERAIALEPDLPEAHLSLGMLNASHDWDWKAAEASFQRAMALASARGSVTRGAGILALYLGRLEDAVLLNRRAVTDDPLSPAAFSALGNACRYAGLFDEARAAAEKALELAPQRNVTHLLLGLVLMEEGRLDEARVRMEREPARIHRLTGLAAVHHAMGRHAESDSALRQLIVEFSEGGAFQIAAAHAGRGELDQAFEWLHRGYAQRDPGLPLTRSEPVFRVLHDDPRWAAFSRKMGFTE